MSESLRKSTRVHHLILQERLEKVKELSQTDLEAYEIHKDKETGEHYLLYYYEHLNIADSNHRENYYHLMPLDTDEVLAIILGEEKYVYPEYWHHAYLRNSAEDESYAWFDPAHVLEFEKNEKIGADLKQMLTDFKQKGDLKEEAIKKLFEDLDKL
ncbi:MAG: hypothetical protein JWM44_3538 [Bacilli bacterium]|nr:hypothetical protein [Bacilli bacterium]